MQRHGFEAAKPHTLAIVQVVNERMDCTSPLGAPAARASIMSCTTRAAIPVARVRKHHAHQAVKQPLLRDLGEQAYGNGRLSPAECWRT